MHATGPRDLTLSGGHRRRRAWMPHRQAYAPRLWPLLVIVPLIVALLTLILSVRTVWLAVTIGVLGGIVPYARLWWWRRQHPVLSVEEFIDLHRRAARWN